MKIKLKEQYTPPAVEVYSVALEGNIAVQSPAININLNDWNDPVEVKPDTGDIYLPI
jgi:hypothetical protein